MERIQTLIGRLTEKTKRKPLDIDAAVHDLIALHARENEVKAQQEAFKERALEEFGAILRQIGETKLLQGQTVYLYQATTYRDDSLKEFVGDNVTLGWEYSNLRGNLGSSIVLSFDEKRKKIVVSAGEPTRRGINRARYVKELSYDSKGKWKTAVNRCLLEIIADQLYQSLDYDDVERRARSQRRS